MKAIDDILLVGHKGLGDDLATRLPGRHVVCHDNPYDALAEMGRRRWPAVILSADCPDFGDLCRASRHLQKDSPLLGLCDVPAEPMLLPLVGTVLDDYFLYPPTRADIRKMSRLISGPHTAKTPAALAPADIARLIESAQSIEGLEASLAALAEQITGAGVVWVDAQQVGQLRPLLLAAGEVPRVLALDSAGSLDDAAMLSIGVLGALTPSLIEAATRTETLQRLAITDHLTGVYNRRYFCHLTDQILARSRNVTSRVALLLYDIDNFKRYNDTFSYEVGDEILKQTAALMKRISRSQDVVARIGGDEFAVLFWDADKPRTPGSSPIESPYDLAERFRKAVNTNDFPLLGDDAVGTLTISGGLAMFPRDGMSVTELLRNAHKALRQAKQAGKNGIRIIG